MHGADIALIGQGCSDLLHAVLVCIQDDDVDVGGQVSDELLPVAQVVADKDKFASHRGCDI